MKKIFLFTLLSAAFAVPNLMAGGPIEKQTFIYSVKGADTLRLDKYELPGEEGSRPCVVFVFGGGFVTGTRDNKNYLPYFHYLAGKGYKVVSIDYRLGLKMAMEAVKKQEAETGEKAKMRAKDGLAVFTNTIEMAVEDLFDATDFILRHADEWNVDKSLIISSGSSAGAITVLQGEYEICSGRKLAEKLPEGFNYAGVISFAGAVFSTDGNLKWTAATAPIQMFHGDADRNVPYDKVRIPFTRIGFFGSKHIAGQLTRTDLPHYFYDVVNADHSVAVSPMSDNLDEIDAFISRLVLEKEKIFINTTEDRYALPKMKKKFGIMEYVRANGLNL